MPLYWIALNAVKGLGPVRIKQLLSLYESPESIFREKSNVLQKTGLIPEASLRQLGDPDLLTEAQKQIDYAQSHAVRIFTLNDPDFPELLREIFAPPPVLYAKGNIQSAFSRHSIAVVGTRNPTAYGKNATEHLVKDLTGHSIAVISGLASGIDSFAHRTCIESKGTTIAVLGCGIDTIYPAANRHLAQQVQEQGALVSEFPIGTEPLAFNFPRRNRIISGLSAGVLVIEAGKKSGSLITAHFALQQGREVFAVPGSIFSEKSEGTFNLIKSGAVPVRSAQDVIDNIQVLSHRYVQSPSAVNLSDTVLESLNKEEKAVLQSLSQEPLRIDQIAAASQREIAELFTILLNLELRGIIKQQSGQQYVRV